MRIHFLRSFFDGKSMYVINNVGIALKYRVLRGSNIRFVKWKYTILIYT